MLDIPSKHAQGLYGSHMATHMGVQPGYAWVRVFTGSGLITGSDRIGPEIGIFLCLTGCFFLYKNDVHKRLCI